MKISAFFIFFLTCSLSVFGQSKNETEAKEFFWGAKDKYKNVTEIPEKWKNESAVILYKNENYDFHKSGGKVTYKRSIRKRIKLLDMAAVEDFSEFSFQKRFRSSKGRVTFRAKGSNTTGIKIVKSDGKEIEIDVDEAAVVVDGESKIAISHLEVGDIIDYYFYQIEPFKTNGRFGFEPVENTLSEEYPIVDYKLFFETENGFYLIFNSFNGAPDLKRIRTKKNSLRQYQFVASNIEKNDFPRWFYPLVELPSYKFQVYFSVSGKLDESTIAFLPEKQTIIKKSVSKDEVLNLYNKRFKPDGDIGDLKSFVSKNKFKNDSEKVSAVFYYMRHYYMTRFFEAVYVSNANILANPYIYYGDAVFIQDQKEFIRHFTVFLSRQKIDYEIVIAKKRYDGSIDDLLLESNINVLLKIKTSKPLYAEYFGPHTSINQYSPLIEDTDVYLLAKSKNKIDQIKNGKLSVSSHSQNESKKEITLKVNEDFTGFSISAVSSYKGHIKTSQQYDRLLFSDYVYEDYRKYKTISLVGVIKRKKDKQKCEKELNALIEKYEKDQIEKLKKSAEGEFGLQDIEDYKYSINNTGRYGFDSYLTYTETFKAKNALIKKAGPNYIIEIGKLIGGQIDLKEKERERTANIYMDYARSFNYEIKLEVPDGFSVSGLDKLTKFVDNVTGAFISTAKIENNILIINTSKQYKHNYEPSANWNLMIEFLDEALQFKNEKILLKKK